MIGNNAEVARYSGISVDRVKLVLLTTSGFVAGLRGTVRRPARIGPRQPGRGVRARHHHDGAAGRGEHLRGLGNPRRRRPLHPHHPQSPLRLGVGQHPGHHQTGIIGALLIASVLVPNLVDRFGRWRHRSGPTQECRHQPERHRRRGGEARRARPEPHRTPWMTVDHKEEGMKTRLSLLAGVISLALIAAACGGRSEEPTETTSQGGAAGGSSRSRVARSSSPSCCRSSPAWRSSTRPTRARRRRPRSSVWMPRSSSARPPDNSVAGRSRS